MQQENPMQTKLIYIFVLLFIFSCSTETKSASTDKRTPISTTKVIRQEIKRTMRTSGVVSQEKQMKLSFKVSGIIQNIYVNEGQSVRKGDVLARLDLTEINARYTQAKEAHEKAMRDFVRVERLKNDNVVTQEVYDNVKSALKIAEADYKIADYNKAHSKIVAPSDGKILKKLVESKELISLGHPVFMFSNSTSNTIIKSYVTGKDLVRLKLNDKAMVQFNAYTDKEFAGTVYSLPAAAHPETGTFQVEILVEKSSTAFITGMIATVFLYPSDNKSALVIPVDALFKANKHQATVFVYHPKTSDVEKRLIEVGDIYHQFLPVKKGLNEGEHVVVEGVSYLKDHTKVKRIAEKTYTALSEGI